MKITIKNSLHNTSTIALTRDGRLTKRQIRRIRADLCGMKCACGGDLKEYGQESIMGPDGPMEFVIDCDGGGKLSYY